MVKPNPPSMEKYRRRNPVTFKRSVRNKTDIPKGSSLQELSQASGQYNRSDSSSGSSRRRPSFILSVLAALAAGTLLTFIEPFEYRCTANFQITGEVSTYQQTFYRKELLNYIWYRHPDDIQTSNSNKHWFVDVPEQDKLRFCLTSTNRQQGLDRVETMAQDFATNMETLRIQALSTPTEGENILTEFITILQDRMNSAQENVAVMAHNLPENDPSINRDTLRTQWQSLHDNFQQIHVQLIRTLNELNQLRSDPVPTIGIISPQERNQELQVNHALQQDLKELAVNLSELKRRIIHVWQQSSGLLEKLSDASLALLHFTQNSPLSAFDEDILNPFNQIKKHAQQYQEKLTAFTQLWTKEFVTLQKTPINAYNDDILATYHRTRSQLNDFLYSASKILSDIRLIVTNIGENQSDNARYYVFQSELIRSFQTVQTAHNRFEYSASHVETPDNFRLDAALKSAQGLYRRSQQNIASIEKKLKAKALTRAKERRKVNLIEASRLVDDIRISADKTIAKLVSLQAELNLSTDETEAFHRTLFEVKLATGQLQSIQSHIGEMSHHLRSLEDQHAASVNASRLELLHCDVTTHPVNLTERLRMGGLGAMLTFFTVILGQLWINRRN